MYFRIIRECYLNSGHRHFLKTLHSKVRAFATDYQSCKGVNNVFLMGSPGAGKTTVGGLVGPRLGMTVLDIDNDHLERFWNMSVADKLGSVGSENFISAEGEAVMRFEATNSVVSLSGSNPMHPAAMRHIRNMGIVVFLDVQATDIVSWLQHMKVDRIVGQRPDMSMLDILQYRQQFYEGNYDIRVICEPFEPVESVAEKVALAVNSYKDQNYYVSTRQDIFEADRRTEKKSFSDVILEGLAPDEGLYVPSGGCPAFTTQEWGRLVPLSYKDRALRILERWIHPSELHPSLLSDFLDAAYSSGAFDCHKVFPVKHLGKNQYMLELFTGPTASFKDAALQLMPFFFQHAVHSCTDPSTKYLILVATSGDTGSAVLHGFNKIAESGMVKVMVLYPEDGVSSIQKMQMTSSSGDNVHVVGVEGHFDFCQSCIKSIFRNQHLGNKLYSKFGYKLSAANSINWGRLLPQIVYHASSYLDLVQDGVVKLGDQVDVCIPTGNFGNLLACYYAKQMGIPFRRLICASNENNILTEFFNTGRYYLQGRSVKATLSPAIDILKSSNLERYLYHVSSRDHNFIRKCYSDLAREGCFVAPSQVRSRMGYDIHADWCSAEQAMRSIKSTFKKTGYLMDPHTAVAKVVADNFPDQDYPLLINSTAHYNKFPNAVIKSLGLPSDAGNHPSSWFDEIDQLQPKPHQHKQLRECLTLPRMHQSVCSAHEQDIVREIESFLSKT